MKRITSIATLLVFLAVGFILALGAVFAGDMYLEMQRDAARKETANYSILALQPHALYLTVESYDPASRTIIAQIYSPAANQFLRQKLKLDEAFSMQRRDAIIEAGVITGARATTAATESELVAGVRGIGIMRNADDGTTLLTYLEIGDPFSRP